MPKSVIDVGTLNNQTVKLHQTERESGQYIALSHCWGPVELQPLRTLTTNIEDLSIQIPWDMLSRTFRDAIWLTQALGVRYLWIDSLCIVQDSMTDWNEQSAEMGGVYGDAFLTVAATRGANGEEGLFHSPKDQYEILPDTILRKDIGHTIWSRAQYNALKKESYPLLFRGWCLQERLLSSRILHFNTKEMVLECNTETACECGWFIRHDQKDNGYYTTLKVDFYHRLDWEAIVSTYSSCDLTRYTDILVALSGVARNFALKTQKTYLGGLWVEDLPSSLLWVSGNDGDASRTPTYTAPSLSWASRLGFVNFIGDGDEDASKILNWGCTTDTVNPYGAVTDGFLKVSGTLLDCQMRNNSDETISKADIVVKIGTDIISFENPREGI